LTGNCLIHAGWLAASCQALLPSQPLAKCERERERERERDRQRERERERGVRLRRKTLPWAQRNIPTNRGAEKEWPNSTSSSTTHSLLFVLMLIKLYIIRNNKNLTKSAIYVN
jgi:hypothetical protein